MLDRIWQHWKPGMIIAPDVEATGTSHISDQLFGISVTIKAEGKYISEYIDVREHNKDRVIEMFNQLFAEARHIVNHNIKYDVMMMRAYGIKISAKKCICSMVRASLIDEHLHQYNLDAIATKYLQEEKVKDIYDELAERFGGAATRKVQILNLHRAPREWVAPYAEKDTELAYKLYEWQEAEIQSQGLQEIDRLERDTFPTLVDMEYQGLRIDLDEAEKAQSQLQSKIIYKEKNLRKLIGDININSPKQLKDYFNPVHFDGDWYVQNKGLRYPIPKTKTGAPSFGKAVLQDLPFPEVRAILELKTLKKTKGTFIDGHILGHAIGDRVYPSLNQTRGEEGGTRTGRLSYSEPAMQQIPARDIDTAKIVRPIFLPEEGHVWVYGDLDQHEFRVFAHYANSKPLTKAYRDDPNMDAHGVVAEMMHIPRKQPQEGGANAKQLNLAIVFCMSDGRVASVLGLPFTMATTRGGFTYMKAGDETMEVLKKYHKTFPGIKELQNKIKVKAKATGMIRSIKGRHLRFPRGRGSYKSPALLFQGSSGDLNKENMNRAHKILKASRTGARLLLNIHDEYSMSMPEDQVRHLVPLVQEAIQDRPELRIPIRIDFNKPGPNWWLATQKG